MSDHDESSAESVGTRLPELIVSGVLALIAVVVIMDSIRVGIGWGDDGPRSGYFPFYVGVLLLLSSGSVFVGQLIRWRDNPEFAERGQLVLVVSVLIPMIVYVAAIWFIGIYIASFGLIAYFMIRHGKYGIPLTAAVGIGVPLVFFLVFERWFLVPLPKGPVEALFGL